MAYVAHCLLIHVLVSWILSFFEMPVNTSYLFLLGCLCFLVLIHKNSFYFLCMFPLLGVVLQIVFGLWWWLISWVSSAGERDAQIAGKTLLLAVSVLLGEISIWIRLDKEHRAHWCSGHHPLRTWTGQKAGGGPICSRPDRDVHLPLDMDTHGSGAFGLGLGPTVLLPLVLQPLSCQLSVLRAHKPHRPAGTWSGACQALELWENKLPLFKPSVWYIRWIP